MVEEEGRELLGSRNHDVDEGRELFASSSGSDGPQWRKEGAVERRNGPLQTFVSVYSMMFFPLGVGPAFAYTGWIPGLLGLTYCAWASFRSGSLLAELCTADGGVGTYPALAKRRFGARGERLITTTQTCLYFMCGVFNIAYMPANFEQLLHTGGGGGGHGTSQGRLLGYMVATWAVMCLGSFLPTYHDTVSIALFSAVVSTLNAAFQLVVVAFYQRDLARTTEKTLFGSSIPQVLSALPAIGYTFGGHGVFPEEIRELKNPNDFHRVVKWLYAASLPWYYLCSAVSYCCYGNSMGGNPIANWPQGLWLTKLAAVFSLVGALVISVTTNQATLLAIENLEPHLPGSQAGGQCRWFKRAAVKFFFVTSQLVAALLLKRTPLQDIQGLMGSLGVGCLTFVFPFVLADRSAQNSLLGVLGALIAVVGMVSASYRIIISLKF